MAKNKKKVAIVIPTHHLKLSSDDIISLKHLEKYLAKYDKIIAIPEHLDQKKFKRKGYAFIKFPSYYFSSWQGYCELLLKKEFFEKFTNYEYILIYQLDVAVFSDQLIYWCNKGYDYIGPPLINTRIGQITSKFSKLFCGNGGFSLRKVSSALKVISETEKSKHYIPSNNLEKILNFLRAIITLKTRQRWLNSPAYCYTLDLGPIKFAEDGFWSFEASKYNPKFKVAPVQDALKFGFERYPRFCYKLNNNKIPFGVHAWKKHDLEFWKPHLLH